MPLKLRTQNGAGLRNRTSLICFVGAAQLGTSEGTLRILFEVCQAGTTQADMDPDIQILRQSGFLPTSRIGHVDFGRIPRGLNAEERENFLRERGSEICFPQCKAPTSERVRRC